MTRMREAGFTYKEIGDKLGVPWSTIRSRCKSVGALPPEETPYRPRNRPIKNDYPRWLIQMLYWDCQLSTVDIAYELDMSKDSVVHMMMRLGISRRTRKEAAKILRDSGFYRTPTRVWTVEEARAASLKAAKKRERKIKLREYKRQRRLQKVAA